MTVYYVYDDDLNYIFESPAPLEDFEDYGIMKADPIIIESEDTIFRTFNLNPVAIFGKMLTGQGLRLQEAQTLNKFDIAGLPYYDIDDPDTEEALKRLGASQGTQRNAHVKLADTPSKCYIYIDNNEVAGYNMRVILVTCINRGTLVWYK